MLGVGFALASFYRWLLKPLLPLYSWLDYVLVGGFLLATGLTGRLLFGELGRKWGRYDSEPGPYMDAGTAGFFRTLMSTMFFAFLLEFVFDS